MLSSVLPVLGSVESSFDPLKKCLMKKPNRIKVGKKIVDTSANRCRIQLDSNKHARVLIHPPQNSLGIRHHQQDHPPSPSFRSIWKLHSRFTEAVLGEISWQIAPTSAARRVDPLLPLLRRGRGGKGGGVREAIQSYP